MEITGTKFLDAGRSTTKKGDHLEVRNLNKK